MIFTVPLARVVAIHKDLPHPYRRYQIGPSFRDEVADNHHYRQFIQCDADVVGCTSLLADAEFIVLAYTGLKELGFSDFLIRVNHRKIFQSIVSLIGMEGQEALKIQRALDKSDKHTQEGIEGIKRDLGNYGIRERAINILIEILKIDGSSAEMLVQLQGMIGECEGINELRDILLYLPKEVADRVTVDLSLARGADYYTGFIFEGVINHVSAGAVLGGGRYDNLIAGFGGSFEPAIGMAFGFERILLAMRQLEIFDLLNVDRQKIMAGCTDKRFLLQLFSIASQLRSNLFEVITIFDPVKKEELLKIANQQLCDTAVLINGCDDPVIKSTDIQLLEKIKRVFASVEVH